MPTVTAKLLLSERLHEISEFHVLGPRSCPCSAVKQIVFRGACYINYDGSAGEMAHRDDKPRAGKQHRTQELGPS